MGCADVVPGVSGGTMAFIMGIYQELIQSIKSFNVDLLKKVLRLDVKAVMDHIPWAFLVCILGGIATAVLSLVHFLSWCLEEHPVHLYSLFFGLILASIVVVGKHAHWKLRGVISLIAGIVLAYWLVGQVPHQVENTLPILFFSGMIAITAMILPGISGSFILLILGQYEFVIGAIKDFNLVVIIVFGLGCVTGLMGFSRILDWLLKNHEQVTMTLLVGFMIGSLRRIWPWKNVVDTMMDRHGDEVVIKADNILPSFSTDGFWLSAGLMVVGVFVILALQKLQKKTGVEGAFTHD